VSFQKDDNKPFKVISDVFTEKLVTNINLSHSIPSPRSLSL